MGCDIHLYVETKIAGIWKSVDTWETDSEGGSFVPYEKRMYTGRNYELFAMLANVRNDVEIIPIAQPKGLPKNISPEILSQSNSWGEDGHSHSFFTVKELLKYDWSKIVNLKGIVSSLEYFKTMRFKSFPKS